MDDILYKQISEELKIPEEVVKKAYISFWEFIKYKIEDLPLKENLSEEEFNRLRTNFNIPSLGKLCCTYDRFAAMKSNFEIIKKLKNDAKNKEDKTNV